MNSTRFIRSKLQKLQSRAVSNRSISIFILLLLALACSMLGGCRRVWLSADNIETDDFEDVRSVLKPDLQKLFSSARNEFAGGAHRYMLNQELARHEYGVWSLHIVQYEEDSGTTYEVLFAFELAARGFGAGYYYTPSGKLPPWAPDYGVICSKKVDDLWYAFRTVDSQTLPNPKDCPEDTQYQ